MSSDDPVESIFNLIETISDASHRFRWAMETASDAGFRQFVDEIREQLEQYTFELETEIRRLGVERAVSEDALPDHDKSDRVSIVVLRHSLESTVNAFKKALDTPLTAHARAMLKRQQVVVEDCFKRAVALSRAA